MLTYATIDEPVYLPHSKAARFHAGRVLLLLGNHTDSYHRLKEAGEVKPRALVTAVDCAR